MKLAIKKIPTKALASGLVLMFSTSLVSAQGFAGLLDALKSLSIPNQNGAPAAIAPGKVQPQSQTGNKEPSMGAKMTENYCRNLFSVAAMEERGPINENLVSEEFNLVPGDFYDEAAKAFDAKPGYVSYAFPSPNFYQHEFETDKINVIYDLILSYPSPKYMAVLIAESRTLPGQPRYDNQSKIDAVAALSMIHFRMQQKSKNQGRWAELAASLINEDHYLAKVISARLLKSGEIGRIDITKAISLANEANSARSNYQRERKEWSPKNYQITSNQTLYEVVAANPTNSQSGYFAQFLKSYQRTKNMTEPFPEVKAQLGPGLAEIEKSSRAAAEKAGKMLSLARDSGNIQAQKASLDSALKTRVSDSPDYNVDQRTMAELSRQLEKVDQLNKEQKEMLDQSLKLSHDSGDRAIMMMPSMLSAMMTTLSKGMEYLPTLIPYSKRLQAYSDGACSVISRIDHTVMVKKLAEVTPERSGLASMMAEN